MQRLVAHLGADVQGDLHQGVGVVAVHALGGLLAAVEVTAVDASAGGQGAGVLLGGGLRAGGLGQVHAAGTGGGGRHTGDLDAGHLGLGQDSIDGGTGAGRGALELTGVGIEVQAVEEAAALTAVAHTVVVVVRAVAVAALAGVAVLGTAGLEDQLAGDQLAGSTVVGGHNSDHLTGRETLVLHLLEVAVGVVDVDRLDGHSGAVHVNVDELAGLAHGARHGVTGVELLAQDQPGDLQVGGGQVVHGAQGDRNQVTELGVVQGQGGAMLADTSVLLLGAGGRADLAGGLAVVVHHHGSRHHCRKA